jgi:hypothetical protein
LEEFIGEYGAVSFPHRFPGDVAKSFIGGGEKGGMFFDKDGTGLGIQPDLHSMEAVLIARLQGIPFDALPKHFIGGMEKVSSIEFTGGDIRLRVKVEDLHHEIGRSPRVSNEIIPHC